MGSLGWRVGVEVELMAPPGRTRRDLAVDLAGPGGRVDVYFHPQSEPSAVAGMKVFDSLTLGFRAFDAGGSEVVCCVDDLTLQAGLDRERAPRPGWFRIVSDERRLLNLVQRHAPAGAGLDAALAPIADLFGTEVQSAPAGMRKVVDTLGAPICIGAPLPGERERPCELVTPPIGPDADFDAALERLLGRARSLGFAVPVEAATHLHLEAARLEAAPAFANLVELLATWGDALKGALRTNPRCVRLGPMPDSLREVVRALDFRALGWEEARARIAGTEPSKYVDWNIKNLAHPRPDKPTFEVRVLPGSLTAEPIGRAARWFVALAVRCAEGPPVAPEPARDDLDTLLASLVDYGLDPALAGASGNTQ